MTLQHGGHEPASIESQLAVIETRLDFVSAQVRDGFGQMKIDYSELWSTMKALEERERERNGQIRDLMRYRIENEQHWAEHMLWAADRDRELAVLKEQQHDATIRRGVWRWLAAGVAAGATATAGVAEALSRLGVP